MDKKVDQVVDPAGPKPGIGHNLGVGAGSIGRTEIGSETVVTSDSNRASQVLNEGQSLAALLRHKEYMVAHLLLAISRSVDGAQELLKWDVKADNVNLLCWKALEREPILKSSGLDQGDPSGKATVSTDIMEVHRRAGIIAAEKKHATLEFGDLVEAIVASRISPRFVHLYAAEPADAIIAQIRDNVKSIKLRIEQEFPSIHLRLDTLQNSMQKEFDRQRADLQKGFREVRFLGLGLLGALIVATIYFGLR
jgi:ATP-dependent Clp protease ATP-binding subunit ClpA